MTANLTPTSYAILGLLAIKPWTTYELATQVERTVKRFWPRTRSKLYEEPKKLVAAGLAVAQRDERRTRDVDPVHGELDHAGAAPLEAAHDLDVEGEAVGAGLREHLAGEVAAHHLEPALGVVDPGATALVIAR